MISSTALLKIRDAAESALQDEIRVSNQKLEELRDDFEHNIRVLAQREDQIHSLHNQAIETERLHAISLEAASKKADDQINVEIERVRTRLELEFNERSRQNEVAFKGKVHNDFEDKLRNCRRELEEEHETSLRNELKYQEKDLIHKFNEKILEKDSTLQKKEEEMMSQLNDIKREGKDVVQSLRMEWKERESNLVERVTDETETEAQKTLERYKNEVDVMKHDFESQIRELLRNNRDTAGQNDSLEQENSSLRKTTNEMDIKIEELFDFINQIENGYVICRDNFHREVEEKENLLREQCQDNCDQSVKYKCNVKRLKTALKQSKAQWKKENENIICELKINKLKVSELKLQINKLESVAVSNAKKWKEDKEMFEEKITLLNSQVTCLINECDKLKQKLHHVENSAQEKYKQQIDVVDNLKKMSIDKEENLTAMFKQKEQELSDVWTNDSTRLNTQLEAVVNEKDTCDERNRHLDWQVVDLKKRLITAEAGNEKEFLAGEVTNSDMKRLKAENSNMKDMVCAMRKEMESLTSVDSGKVVENDFTKSCTPENDTTQKCKYILDQLTGSLVNNNSNRNGHSNCDDEANEKKPQELFRMITNSVNSRSVRSSNQENQLNLNKGKRLFTTDEEVKDLIENFSSEYEGIICEKEHLHDVSNNLKNDLQQAKKSLKTKKGLPIVQKKSDKKLLDDFKINNFAKDLLNNASNGGQEGFVSLFRKHEFLLYMI